MSYLWIVQCHPECWARPVPSTEEEMNVPRVDILRLPSPRRPEGAHDIDSPLDDESSACHCQRTAQLRAARLPSPSTLDN
jgi:hypothetical protein